MPEANLTITEFLEARTAEDESAALASDDGPWFASRYYIGSGEDHSDPDAEIAKACSKTDAAHIARHDPARVLAECAAKRAIVEAHPVTVQLWWEDWWEEQCEIDVCSTCQEDSYPDRWPCPTIAALAAIHRDHPDYRQEWAL